MMYGLMGVVLLYATDVVPNAKRGKRGKRVNSEVMLRVSTSAVKDC